MKEMKIIRGLILSAITAISMIAGDVQDMQGLKTGATPACCSKLVTGQVWQDGMAVPTSSTGSMSQTGTLTWSGGTTTQGTSGGTVSGASNYYSDANSISGTGLYGATSGSGTWTVPPGVTKLQVVIVGGGGNGGLAPIGGSGGGSGYVVAKTAFLAEGTQIPWSVGVSGQQSCFNGWCAAGGLSGGGRGAYGGNGGSGGGGNNYSGGVSGGGGGGYGGIGGSGGSGSGAVGGDGGTLGRNGSILSNGGSGQGAYTSIVVSPLTVKLLTTGASAYLPFTSGQNGAAGSFSSGGAGGTGYGGGGGGGSSGGKGGNGAILIWTE